MLIIVHVHIIGKGHMLRLKSQHRRMQHQMNCTSEGRGRWYAQNKPPSDQHPVCLDQATIRRSLHKIFHQDLTAQNIPPGAHCTKESTRSSLHIRFTHSSAWPGRSSATAHGEIHSYSQMQYREPCCREGDHTPQSMIPQ